MLVSFGCKKTHFGKWFTSHHISKFYFHVIKLQRSFTIPLEPRVTNGPFGVRFELCATFSKKNDLLSTIFVKTEAVAYVDTVTLPHSSSSNHKSPWRL